MSEPEKINRNFTLRGPAANYFQCDAFETLLEGGTRCGKSFAFLIKAKTVADMHPGSRQLICRQTRKSLNESILRDWREEILWTGHPAVSATSSREHQDRYTWKNGAEVVFAGLENARDTTSPILSTKWDRIYVCQAEETSQSDWELLSTRLSSFQTPYRQLTADCNPAAPSHWLNQRFSPDKLNARRARFAFRHYDNPSFYEGIYPNGQWTKNGAEYMAILESTLTGIRRARFLESKWVAAEGQILDNWDPRIHSVDAELRGSQDAGFQIIPQGPSVQYLGENPIRVAYFTAGVDWGWAPDPGVMTLWAYDSPRWHPLVRRFRVAEVMKLKWQRDEWAELACEWWARYGVRYFSCDPSDPENINYFNLRLSKKGYRNGPKIAVKCPAIGGGHRRSKNNAAGIDLMREGLMGAKGHVRSYFLKDAFPEGVDEELRRTGRATCFEQEVESWVYEVDAQGNATEKPSRKAGSHANACFVAGTKILTTRGQIPIEDVMIGDRVLVPYEDEVIALWESEDEEEVWSVETSVGTLRGTGNHPLWTTSGWQNLAEMDGAGLFGLVPSRSPMTALRGIAIRALGRLHRAYISLARSKDIESSCTDSSGSARSGRAASGSRSITSTATARTTLDRTWKSCRPRPIEEGIRSFRWPMNGGARGYVIHAIPGSYLGSHGRAGRSGFPDHELAEYVAETLKRGHPIRGPGCAAMLVGSSIGGTLTPIITTASAPRRSGSERVFTLSVKSSARYVANGIMVSNCYASMYDEMLNYSRGFGRETSFQERPAPDTVDWLLWKDDEDDRKKRRKGRRPPW